MEHFRYKDGCGVHGRHTHIMHLKEELAWAIDKWLWVINNTMSFKICSYTTMKLKNKVALNLKQYFVHYYDVISNVFYM